MNKSEIREVNKAKIFVSIGYHGAAARSISALIRCAMTSKSREALMQVAADLGIASHPEFIV